MTAVLSLLRRTSLLMMALILFSSSLAVVAIFFRGHAGAAQITSRSLAISSSANGTIAVGNPGEGGNGQKAKYTFSMTLPTSGNVGSILLQICTTPLPGTTCTVPTGFTAQNVAAFSSGTTAGVSSAFAIDTSTSLTGAPHNCSAATGPAAGRVNCIAVRDTTPATLTGAITMVFGGGASDYITNPTADNEEFFVRITTFSDAAYTTSVDQGTVANSTAEQIEITAKVQETLNFSVGTTPGDPGNSCAALTGSALGLGLAPDYVLDFNAAYDAHSYFRVSTNANVGTVIYYSGDTLKYGVNDINAIGTTAAASDLGTEQFGLAIDSADATPFGYSMTSLIPTAPYDNGDGTITDGGTATFAYDVTSVATPKEIANSTSAGTKTIICDTGSVRYLGNISTTTPPGVYTTTITYLATPTY